MSKELEAELVAKLQSWAHTYGKELCPGFGDADSFGDGMRAAKQQIQHILIQYYHKKKRVDQTGD